MIWLVLILGICLGMFFAIPLIFMEGTETFKAIDKKIANKIKEM